MDVAVVREGISDSMYCLQPWIVHRDALARRGIRILELDGEDETFRHRYDAMLLYVWLDWKNPRLFVAKQILPVMARYAAYRAKFPDTVQILVNHTDMARRPYITPYWRPGDPILYRTPAYDRTELAPLPPDSIWSYELVWGGDGFRSAEPAVHKAGFMGTASGPRDYRQRVAAATARVGIGALVEERLERCDYNRLMASCEIMVCPRGWGEQSLRHWDTWFSGKAMLTDRECDSVEMIPGVRLRDGVHYIVYDEPEEIPDLVERWTKPARRDELGQIARNGQAAALGYDSGANIVSFFESIRNGR